MLRFRFTLSGSLEPPQLILKDCARSSDKGSVEKRGYGIRWLYCRVIGSTCPSVIHRLEAEEDLNPLDVGKRSSFHDTMSRRAHATFSMGPLGQCARQAVSSS